MVRQNLLKVKKNQAASAFVYSSIIELLPA